MHQSNVDSGVAWGTLAPPDFVNSEKEQSLISSYRSLAITASTSGFKKLFTALHTVVRKKLHEILPNHDINIFVSKFTVPVIIYLDIKIAS